MLAFVIAQYITINLMNRFPDVGYHQGAWTMVLRRVHPEMAVLRILLPMLFAVLVGQRHLFNALTSWINHSRSRRLQDGAFLAMLLDSYVVEVGQPWWLTEKEAPPQPNEATPKEIQENGVMLSHASVLRPT